MSFIPIEREEVQKIVEKYNPKTLSIGVLASHSAEEVGVAAKSLGFRTVAVAQKGREELYTKHDAFLFDKIILLDRFSDILKEENQIKLQELNTIFIPNRSFSTYVGYDGIENEFMVPLYGNRLMLKTEERNVQKNQYYLFEKARLNVPKRFSSPKKIDRPVIVKVKLRDKPTERSFPVVDSPDSYESVTKDLIKRGEITEEDLKKAVIEEYILGQKFNANYHAWALKELGNFDFTGFDDRRQSNLHGLLSMPAKNQLNLQNVPVRTEEVGHMGLTMRESLKPLVYEAAEKFLKVAKQEYPPGAIGLFGLQGAIAYDADNPDDKKLEFFVWDLSPRIPGAPVIGPTSPEMRRLSLKYAKLFDSYRIHGPLDLPMLEITYAAGKHKLGEIVT